MRHAAYVLSAWGVTVAAVAAYAGLLRFRGQRLLRRARAGRTASARSGEE